MRSKKLIERIFADWPAKVLSLGAALLLFFFYQLNRLEERYLSVPLEVAVGDEFVPASQYPRSVRITLRGESKSLSTIKESDISAAIDLTAFRSEGSYRVPIQVERKGGALGVDPLEIHVDPTEVPVTLERRLFRFIPVSPSFKGALQSGYELESFEIEPPEIEISGPAGTVGRIVDLKTEAIDLSSRSADFTVKVKIVNKDPFISISGAGVVDVRCVISRGSDQEPVEAGEP